MTNAEHETEVGFTSDTGREAAYRKWAHTDSRAGTRAARAGFLAKFEREVDPDNQLPVVERQKRAERAMKAHMSALARKGRAKRAHLTPVPEED